MVLSRSVGIVRIGLLGELLALGGCCLSVTSVTDLDELQSASGSTGGGTTSTSSAGASTGVAGSPGGPTSSSGSSSGGASTGGIASTGASSSSTGAASAGTTTGSGQLLWVGGVSALDVDQLEAGTATVVASCVNRDVAGWAAIIDGDGGLLAAEAINGTLTLALWSVAQQLQSCASSPTTSFSSSFFPSDQLAFDPQGNVWIATGGEDGTGGIEAYMFSASHLREGGTGAPDALISWSCTSARAACSGLRLAFDAQGYLWLVSVRSIIAYSPATLADAGTTGEPVLGDFFLSTALALDGGAAFGDIVFDSEGNLWVATTDATYTNDELLEFSATQMRVLPQNPTPEPIRTWSGLKGIYGSFGAFDTSGDFWIAGEANLSPVLLRFAHEGVASGPDLIVPLPYALAGEASLAFDPIPPGLPIYR